MQHVIQEYEYVGDSIWTGGKDQDGNDVLTWTGLWDDVQKLCRVYKKLKFQRNLLQDNK